MWRREAELRNCTISGGKGDPEVRLPLPKVRDQGTLNEENKGITAPSVEADARAILGKMAPTHGNSPPCRDTDPIWGRFITTRSKGKREGRKSQANRPSRKGGRAIKKGTGKG